MAGSTDFFLIGSATTPMALSRSLYSTDKKRFLDESTDFLVLSSVLLPPPLRLYISRAPCEALRLRLVNFFGYYPKSQDFSEFRLGNPGMVLKKQDFLPACGNVCTCVNISVSKDMTTMWHHQFCINCIVECGSSDIERRILNRGNMDTILCYRFKA